MGSSVIRCSRSNSCPHFSQRYSYTGIRGSSSSQNVASFYLTRGVRASACCRSSRLAGSPWISTRLCLVPLEGLRGTADLRTPNSAAKTATRATLARASWAWGPYCESECVVVDAPDGAASCPGGHMDPTANASRVPACAARDLLARLPVWARWGHEFRLNSRERAVAAATARPITPRRSPASSSARPATVVPPGDDTRSRRT